MIRNALTVDVEDYFHVSAFADSVRIERWDSFESRVVRNTHRLLELFEAHDVKATFFVLGWVAEREPSLIKDIAGRGHEVACHGYSHQLIYNQTPETFRNETTRAKSILENIIQQPILGYRAASYSITDKSKWALDILAELGFVYDSSIFPVHHDRYGIPGAARRPHRLSTENGRSLIEFPLSTVKMPGLTLPMAGGGYFRLYPYWLSKWGLSWINRNEDTPFIFYLHPWEIDPQQPKMKGRLLSRFRHYNNLDECEGRLTRLLKDFQFGSVERVLSDLSFMKADDRVLKQSA